MPEDCEDVGEFVSNEFKRNSIPLEVTVHYKLNTGKVLIRDEQAVTAGNVIVVDYDMPHGYSVRVMSLKDFNVEFKPVDDPVKANPIVVDVDAKPILNKLKEIKAEMSTKIEGVALPDHANVPHVRIEFDDVNDVPHVWIDGKRLGDEYPLKRINLEWNTNDAYIEPKHFLIDYFDMTKEAGAIAEQYGPQTQQRGVAQSNGVVRRSSTPRSEEE